MSNRIDQLKTAITGTHMMRDGALAQLSDDDLLFSVGGTSLLLGDLCKGLGELQHSYTQSLITRTHDWSYKDDHIELVTNLTTLKSWFADLDTDMQQALSTLTNDDLSQTVDRGNGVIRTIEQQIEIYLQAMLIFLGKLVVYFQSMGKQLPESIQHYIV